MKLKYLFLKRIGVLASLMSVVACGSSPQQRVSAETETAVAGNYFIGKENVYAFLVSGSGGSWVFDKVTKSDRQPDKGYLVRLNDLAPAFDIRIAECTPQAYSGNHKCNPTHPFRVKDVGVIGKIISGGIAAGTAGKVTNVSRTYKTSFNETAFNQAVDEALINSGLDEQRQGLLLALEDYARILGDSRAEIDELKRGVNVNYRDTSNVQLDIQPTVTGLTEYYAQDLDFRDVIELIPLSDDMSGPERLQARELLPCDARQCAQNARDAIASIRAAVDDSRLKLTTKTQSGKFVYEVRCDATTHAGYLFRMQCPGDVTRVSNGPTPMPISVHILARDFDGLYPSANLNDENLKVELGGDEISFTNATSNYLSVTAQTVYYNSQVQTNTAEINIAPGAVVRRSIGEFVSPAIEIESSFRQMTADKARSTSFEFGFAARYRVAGDAADTTLYEQREYNVGCVIENRMRPGSCQASPPEDVQVRKQTPQGPY